MNNYPPGFTQGDHDKHYAQLECCKCGKKSQNDSDFLFNPEDDSVWCYGCNEAEADRLYQAQKEEGLDE